MRHGIRLIGLGFLVGGLGALVATRVLTAMLFGIEPTNEGMRD